MQGGFSYSGQRCTAVKVVLVMEEVADELVKKVNKGVEELTVGMPEVSSSSVFIMYYYYHFYYYYSCFYHCFYHYCFLQALPPPLGHASAWLVHNHAWFCLSAVFLNTFCSAGSASCP